MAQQLYISEIKKQKQIQISEEITMYSKNCLTIGQACKKGYILQEIYIPAK